MVRSARRHRPAAVYAPDGVLDQVASLEEGDLDAVRKVFDWHPLPAADYQGGPFALTSFAPPHYVCG